jgi:hypothetical protein
MNGHKHDARILIKYVLRTITVVGIYVQDERSFYTVSLLEMFYHYRHVIEITKSSPPRARGMMTWGTYKCKGIGCDSSYHQFSGFHSTPRRE